MIIALEEAHTRNTHTLSQFLQTPKRSVDLNAAVSTMIISASGWRKVFAQSGNEEDDGSAISLDDVLLGALAASSFAKFLRVLAEADKRRVRIALGSDSRPTGPLLSDAMLRAFSAAGMEVDLVGVAAAPEIMAYAARSEGVDAFAYISASHNPVGHNGFKFGLGNGGVLDAASASELARIFREALAKSNASTDFPEKLLDAAVLEGCAQALNRQEEIKRSALSCYFDQVREVACSDGTHAADARLFDELATQARAQGIGILGELNGSARGSSIDGDFLRALGIEHSLIHNQPGDIVHRIVPEGSSLELCQRELERLHRGDHRYVLGYVPDNDGDRGNICYISKDGGAKILEAQTLFALVVLAELAWLDFRNGPDGLRAVAVNGPTSMRIDEIARSFGAECRRSEVGEANVVALAQTLREEGFTVRILGEGSNGGNITHPSAVRDPLNSLVSLVKLLSIRGGQSGTRRRPGLFEIWCEKTGTPYQPQFDLEDIIQSLPAYTSTSSYEDRAIMRISSTDHRKLKTAYETHFATEFESRKAELHSRWGIDGWTEYNTEGIHERQGSGEQFRSGKHSGGLKLCFHDAQGECQAYLWMRASGTEPVYRILADVKGMRPELEAYLLSWQRSLIETADGKAACK